MHQSLSFWELSYKKKPHRGEETRERKLVAKVAKGLSYFGKKGSPGENSLPDDKNDVKCD